MNRYQTVYASQETGRWAVFDKKFDLGITGFLFVQDVPSDTWTFTHNLDKLPFLIEFEIDNGDGTKSVIKPSDTVFTTNTVTATFSEAITGTITVVFSELSDQDVFDAYGL